MSDQEPETTDTALLQPQDAGTNTGGITARTVTTDTSSGLSGNYNSQDVNGILSGYAWNGTNITYSFPTDASYYGASYNDQAALSGWQAFSSAQQAVVQYALGLISQYTNLTFTQITETSTTHAALRFSDSSSSAVATSYAYYPGPFDVSGDVWIGNTRNVTPTGGSYAFDSILHEIGHTVGLKHGQDSDPTFGVLPAAHNSTEYSIMDYYPYPGGQAVWSNDTGSGNLTYMVDDISALQYLYGANYNTNSGNTVYKWDPNTGTESINGVAQSVTSSTNTIYETVWDGGGTDTYDLSSYTTNLTVDLRPGAWSTFSTAQLAHLDVTNLSIVAPGNIANANLYNGNTASLIENAIGGSGNDTIIGNDANNVITGGAGNDTIDGGAGTNTAAYSGTASQYQITQLNSTTWQVRDLRSGSPDGIDTLTNIQLLQFSDQTLGLGTANVVNYPDTTISSSAIVLSAAASSFNGTQLQVLTGSATQSGVISESGGSYTIEKTGAGTLFLTATNTYSGTTTVTAGILEIGSGDTAGRLGTGAVVDNAELTFNRSDTVTVANAISGSGHVTFAGSGNTIITANNSYSGGTTISQGTATVGNGSTTGSLGTGAIVDNGELTFSVSSSTTLANAISGTGHVTFASNYGVTITGNDSYSGGTAITTGGILVGNGTTGWITGDVSTALSTGINFNRADNVTFGGNISGQGYLNQLGLGTLTLTGTNSYSAYTNIENGRLAIASAANLGSGYISFDFGTLQFNAAMTLTQNVKNDGAAAFDTNGNNVILSGVLSTQTGTSTPYGGLTKLGVGNLTLTGSNTYYGATSVNAGTLTVNGSIAASNATVASGAVLAGTGTVGTTTIQSGAALSPGSGVGTLHVSGNLILASGSTYAEDLSAASADGVTVTGNVSLSGTLAENFAGGSYSATTYTLLTATGTVSGAFSGTSVTNVPAGFYSAISYDAHHAYLTLAHIPNISIGNASVTEGGILQFTVTLDQATARDVTLSYDTFAGTASMANNDYLGGPGTLTIAAGQTTGTISIQTVDNVKNVPSQTMTVHLLSASLGNLTQPIGTGTINNDTVVPNISIGNASVTEGGVLHFAVTLDQATTKAITLSYDTFAGTASMGNNDYLGGPGSLTIAAGQTTGTISIQTVDNVKSVPSETMSVHLLSTSFGNVTQPIGTGTINNDAVVPNISIGNTSVTEGGVLHFTVTLDQATTKAVTLNYDTFAGTASMANNDYLGGPGTLTIAAGQTTGAISIQTVDNMKNGPSETMTLHLLSTSFGNVTQPIGTGTIVENYVPPPVPNISIGNASVTEGGVLHFTVTLDQTTTKAVTLNYDTFAGTASMADNDYLGGPGTLTIAAGQTTGTINIQTVDNTKNVPSETMTVHLLSTNFGNVTQSIGTGTINNDAVVPNISIGNASVTEGGVLHFTVTLDQATTKAVTLSYDTFAGTASMGNNDYLGGPGTLTIAAGQTTGTINIQTVDNVKNVPSETMSVHLLSTSFGNLTQPIGTGTINNDVVVPNISIGNTSVTEGGVLHFTVTLDQATTKAVTLSYDTFAGTASMGNNDYLGGPGTLTIAAGQTTGTINIQTVDNVKNVPSEAMTVHLLSTNFGNVTQPIGTGTINNDAVVPNISIGGSTVTEGDVLHFAVTLDQATTKAVTLNYDTFAGTASMADNDYLGGPGTLTIAAGQTTGTINIQTVQDSKVEPDETMSVHLLSASFGTITQGIGNGTIVNDDVPSGVPNIRIADSNVTEGGVLHFVVTLDAIASQDVILGYDTFDGTASTADNDYLGGPGTLTIAAGQTTGTINIQTVQDSKVEPDETMSVHLLTASFGTITKAVGNGTIVNDDVPSGVPNISIADASATEGGVLQFLVKLDAIASQDVTLGYNTFDGTATTADNDYLGSSGTLTIAAGQTTGTINIQTVQDSKVEADETMSVHLLTTSFGTITKAVGNGTIVNDDVPSGVPNIRIADSNVTEGGVLHFVVTLDAIASQDVTLGYDTFAGTASMADNDYLGGPGTLTIAAGQTTGTINIQTVQDSKVEPDETMSVHLLSASFGTITQGIGNGTIVNDDMAPSNSETPLAGSPDATSGTGGSSSTGPSAGLPAPVVTTANVTEPKNQTIAASGLFSVTDANTDPIIAYQLWDNTPDPSSGHFVVNGVGQAADTLIDLTPSQLAQTSFVTGTTSDHLQVRAFAGTALSAPNASAWSSFHVAIS